VSGGAQQVRPVSRANEIKTQAACWLARVHAGSWSEEDQAQLDAWLADSHANRATYWRLEAAWAEAAKLAVLLPSQRENVASTRRTVPTRMKLTAAVIVAGLLGAVGANYFLAPRTQSFATNVGGHKFVTLADGSKIELNTDTAVRVADKDGQRIVWLDRGEAFFQIRHDAAHPFVVMAGNQRVTDLGTKFLVRRDVSKIEVSLVEGRAAFERTGTSSPQTALLVPGDVLVATANSVTVTKKPAQVLDNSLAWRRGSLVFFHTTLAEAATELNRYNTRKIVIADADAARLQINGTFPSGDIGLFGRVAHVVLGVNVRTGGDEIVISR